MTTSYTRCRVPIWSSTKQHRTVFAALNVNLLSVRMVLWAGCIGITALMAANLRRPSVISLNRLRRRDHGQCWICGQRVSKSNSTRDHMVPKSRGGSNEQWNLRLAHKRCNVSRGNDWWPLPTPGYPLDSDDKQQRYLLAFEGLLAQHQIEGAEQASVVDVGVLRALRDMDLAAPLHSAILARLEAGALEYGEASLNRPPNQLTNEIFEELLDVLGWACVLASTLRATNPSSSPWSLDARFVNQVLDLIRVVKQSGETHVDQ